MKESLRILITGCGAPGIRGTLYALKHNPDRIKISTVGTDMNPRAVGRYWVDSFHTVSGPEDSGYIQNICNIVTKEAVDILIPQTTREIAILSRHKNKLSKITRVMVSDAPAIDSANNKWKLLETYKYLNLPHPAYHLARTENQLREAVLKLGYPERPVVVKPPVSNGMRGFRVLREDHWDLQRFLQEKPSGEDLSLDGLIGIIRRGNEWPELLVTEYLPGPEYSVDAFIGHNSSVAIPRLRRAIRSGISFDNLIELRPDLIDLTLRAAKHLGLKYAFGFQFKLDADSVPKVLECNPRVQGTMVAGVFSGVNVIWLSVLELLGKPYQTIRQPSTPVSFQRFWGGLGITKDGVYEI